MIRTVFPGEACRTSFLRLAGDETGFPAVALPAGLGSRSGLPVGVSLIGPPGSDWDVLGLGIALQSELGVPVLPPSS